MRELFVDYYTYNYKYIFYDTKSLREIIFDQYIYIFFIEILWRVALKISAIFADSDIDEVCTHCA